MITKQYVKQLRAESEDEGKKDSKKPSGSTYLYIRAYDGDTGNRPISPEIVGWLSPDIKILDSSYLPITTYEIEANKRYIIRVTVTNDGDLECSSSTVELYLVDPSIGFCDTTSNIGCQTVAILGHSKTDVEFNFDTSNTVGHKCLFARIYSLFTNDCPLDWGNFSTCDDRHIAQHNLTIIAQSKTFSLNLNPGNMFEDKDLELSFKIDKKIIQNLKLTYLDRYTVQTNPIDFTTFKVFKIPRLPKFPNPLISETSNTQPVVDTKRLPIKPDKNNTWLFKKVDKEIGTIHVEIPHLGLKRNEVSPINLWVIDKKTGRSVGGITSLVVGE